MMTDRYPVAREVICRRFGSVRKFSRAASLDKTVVIRVIKGTYGQRDTDDSRQRKRIEEAMRSLGAPAQEVNQLWAQLQDEQTTSTRVVFNGRRLTIFHTVTTKIVMDEEESHA